jgi:hypothetical protein
MVVPVSEDAFAAARKLRIYAIPIRKRMSDVSYIAFYRGAPTSSITHYAKVRSIEKNVRYEEAFPSGSDLIAPDDQLLKVYRLDEMVRFRRQVKMGRSPPVSRARYADIKTLRKARYLDEVWPKEELASPKKEADRKKVEQKAAKGPKKRGRKRAAGGRKDKAKAVGKGAKEPPRAPKEAVPTEADEKGERKRKKRSSRRKKKTDRKEEGAPRRTAEGLKVHYIVDGSNVALEARSFKEGGRLRQLELLMEKLSQVKGSVVTVIVDANLRHHVDRRDDLERMIKDRTVLQAPAQTDADEFILMTAESHRAREEEVVIISNDRYQDYIKRYQPRFDWVKRAQQQFMFVFSPDGSEVLEAIISFT